MPTIFKFFLFVFILICTHSVKAQIDPELAAELQNVLNNSVEISNNNGVSAYLILPDGTTWNGTAGVANDNVPITDTTLFHGASTTKFNVAILMLLLQEDGLIDLDDPWYNYVSLDVAFDTTITVRQLLNHTSGIADYLETDVSSFYITEDYNYFHTPQNILENIVSSEPDFPAGTDFQYSNSNYVLAGLVAEAITGNPLHVELRNRIWEPLEMNHTYFGAYDTYTEPTAGVWWDFGYGILNHSFFPTTSMLSFAYGAGNIVSCPTDLGILLDGVMHGEVLSEQSLNEMTTLVPESYGSWTAGYGLGIHRSSQGGDTVLGHDGYYTNLTDMFHSSYCDFTLVTMSNTQTSWFEIFNSMYYYVFNYCAVLDVEEKEDGSGLNIFPNPTQNQFKISSEKIMNEITIIDELGRVIYHNFPYSKSISLELEKEGLYNIKVGLNERTVSRKLVVTD